MARLLGEARVSVLPDGTRFKPEAEAAVKKATAGLDAKIPLKLDTKGLDAQMAAQSAKIIAMQNRIGKARQADAAAEAKDIASRTKMYASMFDQISKGEADTTKQEAANARARNSYASDLSKQINAIARQQTAASNSMAKADKAAADAQQASIARISKAHEEDILSQQKGIQETQRMYSSLFDDLDKRDNIKLNVDGTYAETQAVKLREKLKATLSDIKAKVSVDKDSLKNASSAITSFLTGKLSKDVEAGGNNSGKSFGNGFISGLAKSALFQNPGITAAIIAGLAALPAAIGAVGVLGGIALGAGIVIGAEVLIKSRLKTLTAEIKTQTAILNSKTATAAEKKSAQEIIKQDQQQVDVLNKQLGAFQKLNDAVGDLKNSFLNFAIVVSKPLIQPFTDAVNRLSDQLNGPLKKSFTDLFKAVAPLVKPVETALLEIVQGILPGLTSMLNKARGPLTDLFVNFGKLVGLKVGDWFRAATPYIQASANYFNKLVSAIGSTVTWLIKFGGESAKAFGGSQFIGFGKIIQQIANDLLKIVIPAFVGWTDVMGPVAKDLLIILTPLLNFLAANPKLVKALTELAAAWYLVSKSILAVNIVLGIMDLELTPIGALVVGIAAAVAIAAILIIKNWGPISGLFVRTWNQIWSGAIGPMINFFTNTVPHAFSVTINWLKKNWPQIVGLIVAPMTLGMSLLFAVVVKYHKQILSFISGTWGHIENVITGTVKPIASVVDGVWNQIYKVTKATWNVIVDVVRIPVLIIVGLIGEAWRGIKNLTGIVWPYIYNITKTYWGRIENVITGVVKPVVSVVVGGWRTIQSITSTVWNWLFAATKTIWGHVENSITGFVKPIVSIVVSGWRTIQSITSVVWNWLFAATKDRWTHIYTTISSMIKAILTVVVNGWKTLMSWTNTAFQTIYKYIFNPLAKAAGWIGGVFVKSVKSSFSALVSAVTSIWNGLRAAVGRPINFVIDIWNKFAGFVDAGLNVFGIKKGLNSKVPHVGFSKGGKVPGFAPGVDNVPAMLSPGEFVLTPEAVKKIGAHNLHALNKNARTGDANGGRGAYANGGDVVNDIEKWNGHPYHWGGGANPSTGWDCSSFVNYIVGHDFKLNLPGGGSWGQMTGNGRAHGPVAAAYNNWNYGRGVPWSDAKKGDLAIENNGAHIGFIIQDNTSHRSNNSLQGFAARSTATGTGYEQFSPGAFHLERFADDRGFASQVWDNTGGAVLKAAANIALNGIEGLANGALNHIPGGTFIPPLAKAAIGTIIDAAKNKLTGNQDNYEFTQGAATGPAGVGTSAGEMANGKQLYSYLLANLFNGDKIAAAGATASIWGESQWNPFAQGTGGRGLIGWTPPSTISNSAFNGGMATQLPEIINFVNKNGDRGAIAQMERAGSVLSAANIWGKQVERYGINDVHSAGINLATRFMSKGGMVPQHVFDSGGTLAPGPNMVYNLTGRPEHLTPTNSGGNTTTLEIVGGDSEVEQFIVHLIRKYARIKSGGNVQKAFGKPGA